jgi:hypothetical protein
VYVRCCPRTRRSISHFDHHSPNEYEKQGSANKVGKPTPLPTQPTRLAVAKIKEYRGVVDFPRAAKAGDSCLNKQKTDLGF